MCAVHHKAEEDACPYLYSMKSSNTLNLFIVVVFFTTIKT